MRIAFNGAITGAIGEQPLWYQLKGQAPTLLGMMGGSGGWFGDRLVAITGGVARQFDPPQVLADNGPKALFASDVGWLVCYQPSDQSKWLSRGLIGGAEVSLPQVLITDMSYDGAYVMSGPATDWKVRVKTPSIIREYPAGTQVRVGENNLICFKLQGEAHFKLEGPTGFVPVKPLGPMSWVGYPFFHQGKIYIIYTYEGGHACHEAGDSSKGLFWAPSTTQYGQTYRGGTLAWGSGAGERAEDLVTVEFNPANFVPAPGPVPGPGPIPPPPPPPMPIPIPDISNDLISERAKYGPMMTNDECVQLLNAVAARNSGWGLHSKPSGNNGSLPDGTKVSIDWLIYAPAMKGSDVIQDAGGVSQISFSTDEFVDVDPAVFIPPQGGSVPVPPPVPPPTPPPPSPVCKFEPTQCKFEPTDLSKLVEAVVLMAQELARLRQQVAAFNQPKKFKGSGSVKFLSGTVNFTGETINEP